MNFSCDKAALQAAISTATKALPQKSTLPAIEGIYFQAAGSRITVICTDLTLTIETSFEATVTTTGEALVPGKLFFEIIRKLPEGIVTFSGDMQTGITVSSGGSKITVAVMDPAEFPKLPAADKTNAVRLPEALLRLLINQTIYAAASDGSRPILTGCLFELEENLINVVALDGYRLAMRNAAVEYAGPSARAVVPARALSEIAKILTDGEDLVEVAFTHAGGIFDMGHTRVYCRLLEGEYLKYRSFIPMEMSLEITVDRSSLLDSVDRAWLMVRSENRNNYIIFTIGNGAVTISSRSETGQVLEEIPIAEKGDLEIGFNARYLIECLKNIEDPTVTMRFTTNRSPCLIHTMEREKATFLILPVRI